MNVLSIWLSSMRQRPVWIQLLWQIAGVGLVLWSMDPSLSPWQTPTTWGDLLKLSEVGALLWCGIFAFVSLAYLYTHGRLLTPHHAVSLIFAPYLLNFLFILTSPSLLHSVTEWMSVGFNPPQALARIAAPASILAVFNMLLVLSLGFAVSEREISHARTYVILLVAALYAATTPLIGDLGSQQWITTLPWPVQVAVVVLATAAAQAGLWGQIFLATGFLIDGLRGRLPTGHSAMDHWRSGMQSGAKYGGLFMLVVQLMYAGGQISWLQWLFAGWPVWSGAAMGMLLFPIAKTIIESSDNNSSPFTTRLRQGLVSPENALRGIISGTAVGLAISYDLIHFGDGNRFLYGAAAGALTYAGSQWLWDAWMIQQRKREHFHQPRYYGMGALLGGVVGGAIAWYLDASQLAVVSSKLAKYATVHFSDSGAASKYVIYPLFSKWGAMDLGSVNGGAKLLFSESLAGAINWSLAAPLFGINFIALNAILNRNMDHLRRLFTTHGLVEIVEQTVRVQRWGLWMAPVIFTFLKMAPDPTWYNQDGAIRTLLAIGQSQTLTPEAFHSWSLNLFLGLLAYDWLRVLIWFDHMGLRVATLVNLSFSGVEKLDEATAKYLGHGMRTRVIPEGVRRFFTWAPLLIPFYIPRGADWNYAWDNAEAMQTAPVAELLPPVVDLMWAYGVGLAVLALVIIILARWRPASSISPPVPVTSTVFSTPHYTISNGSYTLVMDADGRGYNRVLNPARGWDVDLTRCPDHNLDQRGKFFYLRELESTGSQSESHSRLWSLSRSPCGTAGVDYALTHPTPNLLRILNSYHGIRAEAEISIAPRQNVESWRIKLTNMEGRPRRLELISYHELTINAQHVYLRQTAFNGLHIGTHFVSDLNAIMATNRLLHDGKVKSREVAFHAVKTDGQNVRLLGYQDSRSQFIGRGTPANPDGIDPALSRSPTDSGLAYTFDAAASLRVSVDLPACGSVEIEFLDGHADNELLAAKLITKQFGLTLPDKAALATQLEKPRATLPGTLAKTAEPIFQFSNDGTELTVQPNTPRPWSHVLANEQGYGAIVNNYGEICSFAGNAQQNTLTPFTMDSVPTANPGQAIYVHDLVAGETHSVGYIPTRRATAKHHTVFGRGYVDFHQVDGDLAMHMTSFVLPDQPAEVRLLRIRNTSSRSRHYRVVPYFEVVLGEMGRDSRGLLEFSDSCQPNALLFRNSRNDFVKGWAFAATTLLCEAKETVRSRFVGSSGRDLTQPHFVTSGHGDPGAVDDGTRIASFAGTIEIPAGAEYKVVVVLGQASTKDQAQEIIKQLNSVDAAEQALTTTRHYWKETLSTLRIETNHPDFDRLVNDWLPYQVLTSRLWGRVGPNQRSGAFGFRDQLQDVLPMVFLKPEWARRQILLHARQQFIEGDVVKWWHAAPNGGTGLAARTRASDPHLWLPYVAAKYIAATGDWAILNEKIPFLEGATVPADREGVVYVPQPSRETGSLYEHCQRAVDLSLRQLGIHGIPLMGTGDWNDGIDKLGFHGKGESSWLGFFLHGILLDFAELSRKHSSEATATHYLEAAQKLRTALDTMWHGTGYIRAIADSGEPLKLTSALMTAWPITSKAVDLSRGIILMESGLKALEKDNMVLLLTPAFTETAKPHPGRIADYPPGVRENGGQYSHGASWLVDASVQLADLAQALGEPTLAERLRDQGLRLWTKISPLGKTDGDNLATYELPPHQQAADIYYGISCVGRGGWAAYTGAAARMLTTAYELAGVRMEGGKLHLEPDAFTRKGSLVLRKVIWQGKQITEDAREQNNVVRETGRLGANLVDFPFNRARKK